MPYDQILGAVADATRSLTPAERAANIERLVRNAVVMHKRTNDLALALDLAAPIPGHTWVSLCCWCADRANQPGSAHGVPRGGDCARCSYSGPDACVVSLPEGRC